MTKGVIDIETGGYSKEKNGLCEIGIIAIDENNVEVGSLSILIKPYERPLELQESVGQLVSYKDDAMAVNGLKVEDLISEGVTPEVACEMICDFLLEHEIMSFIGQNIEAFDKKWLLYFFDRFSNNKLDGVFLETECTMKMAKAKLTLDSYSLDSLCEHFGVVNEESHRAVGDCRATLEVYNRLK